MGDVENVKSVKLWEVKGELGKEYWWEERGEMPEELVKKLKGEGEGDCVRSIAMNAMGDFVFIQNLWEAEEVMVGEIVDGIWKWENVGMAVMNDERRMQRMVVSCSDVGMEDLHREVSENRRFAVKL